MISEDLQNHSGSARLACGAAEMARKRLAIQRMQIVHNGLFELRGLRQRDDAEVIRIGVIKTAAGHDQRPGMLQKAHAEGVVIDDAKALCIVFGK